MHPVLCPRGGWSGGLIGFGCLITLTIFDRSGTPRKRKGPFNSSPRGRGVNMAGVDPTFLGSGGEWFLKAWLIQYGKFSSIGDPISITIIGMVDIDGCEIFQCIRVVIRDENLVIHIPVPSERGCLR